MASQHMYGRLKKSKKRTARNEKNAAEEESVHNGQAQMNDKKKKKRKRAAEDPSYLETKKLRKEKKEEEKVSEAKNKTKQKAKKHRNGTKIETGVLKGRKQKSQELDVKASGKGQKRCRWYHEDGHAVREVDEIWQDGKKQKKRSLAAGEATPTKLVGQEQDSKPKMGAAALCNGMAQTDAGDPIEDMADLGKKKKHKKKRKRRVGKEGDQGSAGVAVPKGPPKRGQQVSLNWANLKRALDAEKAERLSSPAALDDRSKRRRLMAPGKAKGDTAAALLWEETLGAARGVVALDCEMVTAMGSDRVVKEVAAWVGVVDNKGDVLLDSFARPEGRVVDFRTPYSGVRPHNLKNAPLLETVQKKVQQLIQGRLVVGHAVSNDFRALGFDHPREDVRDTSRYRPLMRSAGGIFETVSLKKLALSELGMSIQEGEHNPVEDARAALYLYHKHRDAWEQELAVKKAKMAG